MGRAKKCESAGQWWVLLDKKRRFRDPYSEPPAAHGRGRRSLVYVVVQEMVS